MPSHPGLYCLRQRFEIKDKSKWVKAGLGTIQRPQWTLDLECFVPGTINASTGLEGVMCIKHDVARSNTSMPLPAFQIQGIRLALVADYATREQSWWERLGRGASPGETDLGSRVTLSVEASHCQNKAGLSYVTFRSTPLPATMFRPQEPQVTRALQVHVALRTMDRQRFALRREVSITITDKPQSDWSLEEILWGESIRDEGGLIQPLPLYSP